jgi:hypothetical protein
MGCKGFEKAGMGGKITAVLPIVILNRPREEPNHLQQKNKFLQANK